MATLRSQTGEKRVFPVRGTETIIGRDSSCDVQIEERESPTVSRRHARISFVDGNYFVEDLGSRNGTCLNGSPVYAPTRLKTGDQIQVSTMTLEFDERSQPDEQFQSDEQIPSDAPEQPVGQFDFDKQSQSVEQSQPVEQFRSEDQFQADEQSQVDQQRAGRHGAMVIIDDRGETDNRPFMSALNAGDHRLSVKPEAKLSALLKISQKLSKSLDLDEVFLKVLESLLSIFPQADRCCVVLREKCSGQLIPTKVLHRSGADNKSMAVSRTIADHVINTRQAVISDDAEDDSRFAIKGSIVQIGIRSIMCVPIISQSDEVLGIIQLDNGSASSPFAPEDLDVVLCASTQAAHAIEMATMYEERRDLEAAAKIQETFLPEEPPSSDSIWFYDHYESARDIGGDYYDYVQLPGNRLAIALGDVSGKGASAALLMAKLSTATRFCLLDEPRVADAVCKLNDSFVHSREDIRFVTFVVIVFDQNDFSMTLVNAGHMPPLRLRSDSRQVEELGNEIVGLPLGIRPAQYQETKISLGARDTVVLFTDGVTESRSPDGGFYGPERLRTCIASAAAKSRSIGPAILDDVRRFSDGQPQADDLALVCFGRTTDRTRQTTVEWS